MESIACSACLLGINCKYNGKNNYVEEIEELRKKYNLIPICPEVYGNLGIPRSASEVIGQKVFSKDGLDVTKNFENGAKKALQTALENKCKKALLKNGSPSCGTTIIYDGTFSNQKICGKGITAKLFLENQIQCFHELEIKLLINE